ncbi:beta galactosidase jelly roll domain-containing protein [Pendulispora rubella]|uniref:Beta galactosidase jelly roll domain-containing protein n=1 Tax=Pendulispora rubella TaxID=2741070 RepID=A0ABZ2LB48_9BACT
MTRRRNGHFGWGYPMASGLLLAGCSADIPIDATPSIPDDRASAPLDAECEQREVRRRVDLDEGWRFLRSDAADVPLPQFDDSGWSSVTIPHTWNAKDGQDGNADYYRGIGWYRRHYTVPLRFIGKKLWLQFDGANMVADVWVNGIHLGRHEGGFARFRFDATSALQVGRDNVIAVKVDNAPNANIAPLTADFTFFGGIYRTVSLQVTDDLSLDMLDDAGPGAYFRQRNVDATSATLDVTTKIANHSARSRRVRTRISITDPAGNVVARALGAVLPLARKALDQVIQTLTIADPHLWNGRTAPYRYRARVEILDADTGVLTDVITERIGLRSFHVDANTGFALNGSHLALHGVNRHQDRLDKGWALGDAEHTNDFDIMDEMGVNALRTAHYQQDQKVYDLADERGYVVWTEIPLVNHVTDTPEFRANAEQQLREMIRQNYNHPSIVFWGVGNEQFIDDEATNSLLERLARVVDEEDPERLSTYAHDKSPAFKMMTHAETTGWNKYFGWYYGAAGDFGAWMDGVHQSQPTRMFGISEYGAGASIQQHAANPPKPVPDSDWHPEEYQSFYHETHWNQIAARPYLWGTFVWNMFDFAADIRSEGDSYGRNDKGLVTYDRATRKDAFYFYKANWTAEPFVYITSRRWTNRTKATTTVKVYGNVDSVSLSVNGAPIGTASSSNHIYTWPNVNLAPGANHITVTGSRGTESYTDDVVWTLTTN